MNIFFKYQLKFIFFISFVFILITCINNFTRYLPEFVIRNTNIPVVVSYSPDGRLMAVGDSRGVVHLINACDCRVRFRLESAGSRLTSVGFARDSKSVVVLRDATLVTIWQSETGRKMGDLIVPSVFGVSISDDGRMRFNRFFAGSLYFAEEYKYLVPKSLSLDSVEAESRSRVELSDMALQSLSSGECSGYLKDHGIIVFQNDNKFYIKKVFDKNKYSYNMCVCNTVDNKLVVCKNFPNYDDAWILLGPGCRLACVVDIFRNSLTILDLESGKKFGSIRPHKARLYRSTGDPDDRSARPLFSPDGRYLAATALVEALEPDWIARLPSRYRQAVARRLGFIRPGGRSDRIALARGKKIFAIILVWDVFTGQLVTQLDADSEFVSSIAFSPSGEHIAAACRASKTVKIWRLPPTCRRDPHSTHPIYPALPPEPACPSGSTNNSEW